MNKLAQRLIATIGLGIAAYTAISQTPAPAPAPAMPGAAAPAAAPGTAATPARRGYLPTDTIAYAAVLPPAPVKDDARDQADRRIFLATRKLQGTPRWQMATADAELGTAAMLKHFACSLDIELTQQQAPKLIALLQKAQRDATSAIGSSKDFYKRQRPFLVDEGPICVSADTVKNSFDYPSGHATAGWSWGLVLAQVDPQHATPLLARGRAIGDSRVVCGVHNFSAVQSAQIFTGAVISTVAGSSEYQADLVAARTELAALRAAPHTSPEPARCAAEAELVKSYW